MAGFNTLGLIAVFLMSSVPFAQAQALAQAPIRYALTFPAPHTHYVEVEAVIPTDGQPTVELMMAVWTPGSYLVREYARHVEAVTARDGAGSALAVEKSAKNRWRVQTGGVRQVTVAYRVYGREMSVRTNWIDAEFALINGAPTFLAVVGGLNRPHEVAITLPAAWQQAVTTLPAVAGGGHRFRAPDYDTLVDSPIVLGSPAVYEFTVDGRPHALVNIGEAGVFDGARAAKDLEAVVREHRRMWGALPYERYVFFNLITEGRGGLEHADSSVLMTSRWATRTRKAYVGWLHLASHEFFHAWNVKRLRPAELGPFDYERENTTRSLWVVEGITDYYGDLAVHRAGLSTAREYLEAVSEIVKALQTTPGRLVQAVDLSSYDAWVRHYRPDENSPNVAVSYYTKGYVLAWLLDARIRDLTTGGRSLDDVMREAYRRHAGARGYTQAEFQAVAEQVAGASLADFWERGVTGTGELDYAKALRVLGLRFRPADAGKEPGKDAAPDGGKDGAQDAPKAHLGVVTRTEDGRLLVSQVHRGTPAYEAGLNVDDEIVGIGDFRVQADQLTARLEQYAPGDTVFVLVARRGRFERVAVTLGTTPPSLWTVEPDPAASGDRKARMTAWLTGRH